MILPRSYILIPAIASFLGAIVGGWLTTYLNPRFQHRFWKRQQREEMQFKVANEVNRLIAEYSIDYFVKDVSVPLTDACTAFFQSWHATAGEVQALFTDSTYQAFKQMEVIIMSASLYPNQDPAAKASRVEEFARARDTVLRAIYQEIGILSKHSMKRMTLHNRAVKADCNKR